MTETVKCRVCGCSSSLGTGECPDCGAPLPQERSKEQQPKTAGTEVSSVPDAPTSEKKELSSKLRWARRVGLFVALALALQLTAALWPQKYQPTGMTYSDDGIVSMDGVWNIEEDGFWIMDGTADGRYLLLQARDKDAVAKARRGTELLSSAQLSYTYVPMGDYYLFDGRTLERTDWDSAGMAGSAVFFTVEDENGVTLGCRELNTGEDRKIQTFGEGVSLDILRPSSDGAAVVYGWNAGDDQEPGSYRLWRAKDRKSVAVDVPAGDTLWGVGTDGSCLFWHRDDGSGGEDWGWGYQVYGGYYPNGYYLWRDGDIQEMPNMMLMWCNDALTEFLLREERGDTDMDWYYYDVDAMAAPVRLDVSGESYLIPAARDRVWWGGYTCETLKGRFYTAQDSGDGAAYYLNHRGELLALDAGQEELTVNADETQAVYLKNGELYRVSVLPDDTVETQRLTHTGDTLVSGTEWGTVVDFVASDDLSHIYYTARDAFDLYADVKLYHWQGGESRALDMEIDLNQKIQMTATPAGGCYFLYRQDLYYTEGGRAPAAVIEGEPAFTVPPQLVGPDKWAMAVGIEWEGSQRQNRYWRLNGYDAPVELTERIPKEGKI